MNRANVNDVWERIVVVQEMLLVCGVVGKLVLSERMVW